MSRPGILIVGGGLAGQRCAETLRARGYAGPVRLVCAEPDPPYDRPPLSKGLLAGETEGDDIALRPQSWYAEHDVELILGTAARRLGPERHLVELEDGSELRYEKLLVATGSKPRSLPALEGFANLHFLRTLTDARRLRSELVRGAHLVIIGAGFIGQEVAATARGLGAEVTILEAAPLPLAGALGEPIGRWLVGLHRDAGVQVRLSARLEAARGNGRVEEIELADGKRLRCDAVLVGIGVVPATRWLEGSGLQLTGVRTDYAGRTAAPDVFAAGDVARVFDPRVRAHARAEHWDAAARQGAAVAKAMLGQYPGLPPLPSFWSDQYGLRMQFVGYSSAADTLELDGDMDSRRFAAVYHRGGRPVAGFTVGRPRDLVRLRREIERQYGLNGNRNESGKETPR